MVALQIPLLTERNNFYFNILLDEILCKISIKWNDTDLAWYMNIEGVTETSINVKGIRLVCGIDLLYQYQILLLGSIYMIDNSNELTDPTYDGFGTTYTMMYIPKGNSLT